MNLRKTYIVFFLLLATFTFCVQLPPLCYNATAGSNTCNSCFTDFTANNQNIIVNPANVTNPCGCPISMYFNTSINLCSWCDPKCVSCESEKICKICV